MSKAGWFPDPGGQPGMYRYWDGSAWSTILSPDPTSTPPSGGLGVAQPTVNPATQPLTPRPGASFGGPVGGVAPGASPYRYGDVGGAQPQQGKGGLIGLLIGGVVMLLLIGLIGFQAFKPGGPLNKGGGSGGGGAIPTESVCPKPKQQTIRPQPADGRVHGGAMSYPKLPSPWGPVRGESRLPFGLDAHQQSVDVEPNYAKNSSWVASILVADLNAGDGFYAAEEGASIVAKCVLGTFYGDAKVDRTDITNKAVKVDGHDAWLLEMHLTFDIPNLKTKGETAIILVVDTGNVAAGLYYASIPDTTPQLLPQARDLMGKLKVTP